MPSSALAAATGTGSADDLITLDGCYLSDRASWRTHPLRKKLTSEELNRIKVVAWSPEGTTGDRPLTSEEFERIEALAWRSRRDAALRELLAVPAITPATARSAPRAREGRMPRSRRQRGSATTRGSPASRSSDDEPPLTAEQRRWIAALVAAARAERDGRRRWEMHPGGGSRPLNGRRWLGSLVFVEVPLAETAFQRGDPAERAVRVADRRANGLDGAASAKNAAERSRRFDGRTAPSARTAGTHSSSAPTGSARRRPRGWRHDLPLAPPRRGRPCRRSPRGCRS